jgi:GT2 family glycosyltransferase
MPKIGLVTVLYNSESVLDGFFKSLSGQDFNNYHLYLVDNNPSAETDSLIAHLLAKYAIANYSHIKNIQNVGVAKGNNQGIELALAENADYILLLNNDIEFYQPDIISKMLESAEDGENIIIPKILFFDSKLIWMAGGKLLKNKGYTIHIGEHQQDAGQHDGNQYFEYAPTCFMLIKRIVFEKVGLMDEKYFVYFDDTDFILRAVKAGYKIYYLGGLTVLHKVSSSTGGNETPFSVYYTTRNRIYFISKNLTGLTKLSAYLYTFLTRMAKLATYNKLQRNKMIAGIKDGLNLR